MSLIPANTLETSSNFLFSKFSTEISNFSAKCFLISVISDISRTSLSLISFTFSKDILFLALLYSFCLSDCFSTTFSCNASPLILCSSLCGSTICFRPFAPLQLLFPFSLRKVIMQVQFSCCRKKSLGCLPYSHVPSSFSHHSQRIPQRYLTSSSSGRYSEWIFAGCESSAG